MEKKNYKYSKLLILTTLLLLFLASVSSVSAADFTKDSSSEDIQTFIKDTVTTDTEINLASGDYQNNLMNINITRNLTITGIGQVNIIGPGNGVLFNITSANVTIKNLNISGYDTAIIANSSDISIIGNNIITSIESIKFIGSDLTGILLEDNDIFSSINNYYSGAVYFYASSGSNVNISLIHNNITTNNNDRNYAVYFNISDTNNTLYFEYNNIISLAQLGGGVGINSDRSNTTINFTYNNISGPYAVELQSNYGSVNIMEFTYNNIYGTYQSSLYLCGESSENSLTATFNNLIAELEAIDLRGRYNGDNIAIVENNNLSGLYGFFLEGDGANNTMIINNNDITTTMIYGHGIFLGGFNRGIDENYNNITVTNNNITGIGDGIWLGVSEIINKNFLNFFNNNIYGVDYGIYINIDSFISELFLLNNTIVSDGIGLYFDMYADLEGIEVTGNTIIAKDVGIKFKQFGTRYVNGNFNYNRIIAPIGLDFTDFNDAGVNFDFNWWGINDISEKILGFDTTNHYILNITNHTSLDDVFMGEQLNFTLLVLNTSLKNTDVEKLPFFIITGTFNGKEYSTSLDELFVISLVASSSIEQYMDAHLDEQDVDLGFSAESLIDTVITIVTPVIKIPALAKEGNLVNITGTLTDKEGKAIQGVYLNVTVDDKTSTVLTDENGTWTVEYKPTHKGNITIIANFTGDNKHNPSNNSTIFTVTKGKIIVVITVVDNPDGSVTIIANVTDDEGTPVVNYPVHFYKDGKYIGLNNTDGTGIATITIPADADEHEYTVIIPDVEIDESSSQPAVIHRPEITPESEGNDDEPVNTDETDENSDNADENQNNVKNPTSKAAMKNTGIPIIALIVLLLCSLGIISRKK